MRTPCPQEEKLKTPLFTRTTEAEDEIYFQEATKRNEPTNRALQSLFHSHRWAISTLETDNRISLFHYAYQSSQDIRRDLTVIQEEEHGLSISGCEAHECALILDNREKCAIETSRHENVSVPQPPFTDSESELPDLQSSSPSGRGTNLPPPSGKFSDTSDSESPKVANKNRVFPGYWNNLAASYNSPQHRYSTLCPVVSSLHPLQLFI